MDANIIKSNIEIAEKAIMNIIDDLQKSNQIVVADINTRTFQVDIKKELHNIELVYYIN